MKFFRHGMGFVIGLICLLALIGVLWFGLFSQAQNKEPEGTLVYDWRATAPWEVAS